MAETFSVGNVVIGQNAVKHLEYNGMEGTIVGPLQRRRWIEPWNGLTEGDTYLVAWANGHTCCTWPWQMRRKQPPVDRQEVGEWELCPWQPKQVTVSDNT